MKCINKVEDLYEEIEETMLNDYGKDKTLSNMWKEVYQQEDLIKEILSEKEYNSVKEYADKIYQTMFLERKKAFTYGYKLSNKLMIDSLK